jgi:hypothetical protein
MLRIPKSISRLLRRFWRGLREWCGDAAYNTIFAHRARVFSPALPEEFYVDNSTAAIHVQPLLLKLFLKLSSISASLLSRGGWRGFVTQCFQ